MNDEKKFKLQVEQNIQALGESEEYRKYALDWMLSASTVGNYSYNFEWLGLPIIQFPQDMVALQELVWKIKPDLIIETGVARGGSLMLSASLLGMLDYCEMLESGVQVDSARAVRRKVVGVDIDIREHNRERILEHPLSKHVELIQGSSIDDRTVGQVKEFVDQANTVMVLLDSNHTHSHVLSELEMYSDFVSLGSYCIVFDTVVDRCPPELFQDRPWGAGNNPMTAVNEWLGRQSNFVVDKELEAKLGITVAPNGYLRRVV